MIGALLAGASGVMAKEVIGSDILECIHCVAHGHPCAGSGVKARIHERLARIAARPDVLHPPTLTEVEERAVELLESQHSIREVTTILCITESVRRELIHSILTKASTP